MTRTFGRVTIDDKGVRRTPILWFFGSPFDVDWGDITSWTTKEFLVGGKRWTSLQILLLSTADAQHTIDLSGTDWAAIVKEVEQRLPGKKMEIPDDIWRAVGKNMPK